MDIGTEKPAIVVEPVEDPFRREAPSETPAPVETPEREREPEKVGAAVRLIEGRFDVCLDDR